LGVEDQRQEALRNYSPMRGGLLGAEYIL